jgi:site-specific recombinase XerD
MKISQAYLRYISEYLEIKGVDMNQITHYKASARLWTEIVGDKPLNRLTMADIAKYTQGLKTYGRRRGLNTIAYYIKELRVVLRYWRLRGEETIDSEIIPIPKREPNTPSFLDKDSVNLMIRTAKRVRTKFVISLLYSSGLRVSELRQLNRDSIKDRQFTVIGKGKKERIGFIDARTERFMIKYLSSRKDSSEALLVTSDGHRASVSTIQLIVKNAAKRAGIKKRVSPHTLRHSFATNFISNNGNIRHLALLMGHNSIQTTAIYTHIVDNDLRREYLAHHTC